MIERWCGVCKRGTEQTYVKKSDRWSCDVCNTITEDSLGCRLSFTIQGPQQPQERARTRIIYKEQNARRGHTVNEAISALKRDSFSVMYTPAKTNEFKIFAKTIITAFKPPKLLIGALKVELKFYLLRPKSLPAKVVHHIKKPDHDNLDKIICDSMEGLIYLNDSQIFDCHITKEYGEPRVEIIIEEMSEK